MAWLSFDSPMLGGAAGMLNKLIKLRAGLWVAKILSTLGLGFAAQEFIYEPIIQQAITAWNSVPGYIANWVHALGIDVFVSLCLSAYGIQGASRIFLSRKYESPT
ncbi:hypothetical protein [Stenotrophomonas maltophilia]|uniref:DUF2523 domain-containing protein n=2 Tax=Stenotrophomonas maltophilia TaxID=40324 RepID=A0AAJ2JB19_STEMA|nr:hypothetical protein [Stenotrophomonas maltophilia]MDT3468370.1 hypothetical protein [Stenotrophomonas maltophilia]